MRFLLDENVSPLIGDHLVLQGHDVLLASQACRGAPDEVVVALAKTEARVVITEDKDFGELAFRDGLRPPGVIRLLLPRLDPLKKAHRLREVLSLGESMIGGVLVVEFQRTRFRVWRSSED